MSKDVKKGKDPAVLFYTSDFLTGTMMLSDEQVGKYIRLLCLQHQHGRLTEKHMLNICKAHDEDVFSKFTKDADGLYYNERMEIEKEKRKIFTQSRSENAKGGKNKDKKTTSISQAQEKHMQQHMENENVIEGINEGIVEPEFELLQYPTFDDFWNAYDKKRGDVSKIKIKWGKISQSDKEAIMDYIPKYIFSQPDKQYRKDPLTFLNNKSWNDEIIEPTTKPISTQGNNGMGNRKTFNFTAEQLGLDKHSKYRKNPAE